MNVADVVSARVPALKTRKSPVLAALIGVLTGGVGLAIYFWSLRDLFPVEVATAPARRSLWSLLGHPGLLLEEPESLPDAV